MALGEPAGVDDAADALFDPAMAGVGLCGAWAIGAQALRRRRTAPRPRAGFEGEHVIAAFVDDARGDLLLRSHRIDGHDRSFEIEDVQQLRDRLDLVGLPVNRALGEPPPRWRKPKPSAARRSHHKTF